MGRPSVVLPLGTLARRRRLLLLPAAVVLAGSAGALGGAPSPDDRAALGGRPVAKAAMISNLRVDGHPTPAMGSAAPPVPVLPGPPESAPSPVPPYSVTFGWDFSGKQTGWEIEHYQEAVGVTSGHWLSGQVTGSAGAHNPVAYNEAQAPGGYGVSHCRGIDVYFRVRLRDGSGGIWTDFTPYQRYRLNAFPLISAMESIGAGSSPSELTLHGRPPATPGRTLEVGAGRPYATIQSAVDAATMPGDTVLVHSGTYRETVRPKKSGTEESPVTIKANSGDEVVVDGDDYGFAIEGASHLVVDGFKVVNCAKSGINITRSEGCIIRNNRLSGNGESDIFIYYRVANHKVLGNVCSSTGTGPANIFSSAPFTEIRRNECSRGRSGIYLGLGGSNQIVEENVVHDVRGGEDGAAIHSYTSHNLTFRRNLVYDVPRSSPGGIMIWRASNGIIENNTVARADVPWAGIAAVLGEGHVIRNNLVVDSSRGIHLQSSANIVADFNAFFRNASTYGGTAAPSPVGPHDVLSDPKLAGAAKNDFSLAAGSPLVDQAAAGTPVPLDGGARADIGCFERGAAPWKAGPGPAATAYEPSFRVAGLPAALLWKFTDFDGHAQARFQVEIDGGNTFDTKDLRRADVVSSKTPAAGLAGGLPDGKYHVRVRASDSLEPGMWGSWSDGNVAFLLSDGGADPPPEAARDGGGAGSEASRDAGPQGDVGAPGQDAAGDGGTPPRPDAGPPGAGGGGKGGCGFANPAGRTAPSGSLAATLAWLLRRSRRRGSPRHG